MMGPTASKATKRGGRPVDSCGASHSLGGEFVTAPKNSPSASAATAAASATRSTRFIGDCVLRRWFARPNV